MILGGLRKPEHERLLSGWDHGEDAALWDLGNDRIGILTVDFITPVVDDPEVWGEIAAANALSDVFAMGGVPRVALNVVAYPVHCRPLEELALVLRGGQKKVDEAGAVLAGGHSVEDEEPKYGLVVFGDVDAKRLWRVNGARPGDALLLTKALGTGILVTAIKAGMAEAEEIDAAVTCMRTLNNLPACLPPEQLGAVVVCTDVTGFGLAGHLLDMLGEKLDVEVLFSELPFLTGAKEKTELGLVPAGAYRNRELYGSRVQNRGNIAAYESDVLFDPQTSGGLLLAVPETEAPSLLASLHQEGFNEARRIGRFTEGTGRIELV